MANARLTTHQATIRRTAVQHDGFSFAIPRTRKSWYNWHRTRLEDVRERLFYFIGKTLNLDWLLLTKRPENWRRCWPLVPVPGHVQQNKGDGKTWEIFPIVWMGTSVENREHGIPRIDHLREIPARVRFLSVEPLLEDLGDLDLTGIHWVIVGAESGHNARSMDLRWVRKIRDQCFARGVAFFCKQWGARPYDSFYTRRSANLSERFARWRLGRVV